MLLRSFGRREGGLEGEAPGLRDLLLEVVLGLPLLNARYREISNSVRTSSYDPSDASMRTQDCDHAARHAPGTWAARGIPRSAAAVPLVALLVRKQFPFAAGQPVYTRAHAVYLNIWQNASTRERPPQEAAGIAPVGGPGEVRMGE